MPMDCALAAFGGVVAVKSIASATRRTKILVTLLDRCTIVSNRFMDNFEGMVRPPARAGTVAWLVPICKNHEPRSVERSGGGEGARSGAPLLGEKARRVGTCFSFHPIP